MPGLAAGMDNAIKQAEERGFDKIDIFDADSHQNEPIKTMARYATTALKNVLMSPDPEEDPWQQSLFWAYAGDAEKIRRYQQVASFQKGVRTVKRPETHYTSYQEADELVGIFTRLMVDIGIKTSVVLPTRMLGLPLAKPHAELTVAKAYIEYMLEHFLGRYPEIITLLYVPTNTPDKAAELIDTVGDEKGVCGIMISGSAPVVAGSDDWDPIYDAAQQKRLPVCFHGNRTIEGSYEGMEFVASHALSFPFSLIRHLTSMVISGVPIRFPTLKFAFMEGGVSWLPWLYHRLDDEYTKRRIEAPLLRKLPSEYLKEFYYTSQPLEQSHVAELRSMFELMDFENRLMYASDYPHWDFDVPSVIFDLPFLTEPAKRKILAGNARKFFKLN